jgi:two-component system, NarL family, nitrate/nitrite response regulator NarL
MQQPAETVVTRPKAPPGEGLAQATDFRIVASTSDVGDLAKILFSLSPSRNRPVLLIIDASNKGDDVVSQIKLFKKQYPRGRVAVLADHYRRSDLVSAYRTGANAFFTKATSCGAFIKTLELVMLGETILPPELLPFIRERENRHEHTRVALRSADAPPPSGIDDEDLPPLAIGADALRTLGTDAIPRLSAREKCILSCIVEGRSNKSIARKIGIAVATVKVHVKAILRKIRASNRTQAAIWAVNNSSVAWSTGAPIGDDSHAAARESCYFDPAAFVDETPAKMTVRSGTPSSPFENNPLNDQP